MKKKQLIQIITISIIIGIILGSITEGALILNISWLTYNEDNNGNNPILNINVFKNELTNNNNSLNRGLVIIMAQRHRDYKIIPQIIN